MITRGSVRAAVSGPLARFEAAFRVELARAGYTRSSIRGAVAAMAALSRWLEVRSLAPSELTPRCRWLALAFARSARFCGSCARSARFPRRTARSMPNRSRRCWRSLVPGWPRSGDCQQRRCAATASRPASSWSFCPSRWMPRCGSWTRGKSRRSCSSYCRDAHPTSAKATVTAVRALLRFLHVVGYVPVSLAAAVPAVAGWRLASLPRGLDAAVVGRLLEGCDRDTIVGRRDYAILIILARLGLRGAEVAASGTGRRRLARRRGGHPRQGQPDRSAPVAGGGR